MGKVLYPTVSNPKGDEIIFDDKYSFKDFTHQSLKNVTDLTPGIVIYASCFYQEALEDATVKEQIQRHIFPEDMKGVTFVNCDLNNVYIPLGNTVIDPCGRTKLIKVQNDLSDWELNSDLTAKEPLDKEQRIQLGISIDPKDIPKTKLEKSIIEAKYEELSKVL